MCVNQSTDRVQRRVTGKLSISIVTPQKIINPHLFTHWNFIHICTLLHSEMGITEQITHLLRHFLSLLLYGKKKGREGQKRKGRKTGKGDEKRKRERKSRFVLDTYLDQPTQQPLVLKMPSPPSFYRPQKLAQAYQELSEWSSVLQPEAKRDLLNMTKGSQLKNCVFGYHLILSSQGRQWEDNRVQCGHAE